jgi:hypothetical protein
VLGVTGTVGTAGAALTAGGFAVWAVESPTQALSKMATKPALMALTAGANGLMRCSKLGTNKIYAGIDSAAL